MLVPRAREGENYYFEMNTQPRRRKNHKNYASRSKKSLMKRQEDHKNISMISDRDARAKLWLVFERDFASVSDRKLSVGVFISFAR